MAGLSSTFDSAGVHRFSFGVDTFPATNIKAVDNLSLKVEPVITKTNDREGRPIHKVFAGNKVFVGTLTVTRLLTENLDWYTWFENTMQNLTSARCPCFLNVHDPRTTDAPPVRTYEFQSCMLSELKISSMNAGSSTAADEVMTFHYENMLIKA